MPAVSKLLVVLVATAASASAVLAAPAKTTANIVCDYDAIKYTSGKPQQLVASGYSYNSDVPTVKLGYVDEGNKGLRVVALDDKSAGGVKPLDQVRSVACNSTSLNYFGNQPAAYSATPIKLVTNVVRNKKTYCVGLDKHFSSKGHPSHPTAVTSANVVLTPCVSADDAYDQSNQFWLSTAKYATLFPLVRPAASTPVSPDNTWLILPPSSTNAKHAARYRAGPKQDGVDAQTAYRSFGLQRSDD